MFSCEFCKIFNNTFFIEHLWTSASETSKESNNSFVFLYFFYFNLALGKVKEKAAIEKKKKKRTWHILPLYYCLKVITLKVY